MPDQLTIGLSLCPFCGGKAHVHDNTDPEDGAGYYYAVCESFRCCWGPDGLSELDAAKLWNARYLPSEYSVESEK